MQAVKPETLLLLAPRYGAILGEVLAIADRVDWSRVTDELALARAAARNIKPYARRTTRLDPFTDELDEKWQRLRSWIPATQRAVADNEEATIVSTQGDQLAALPVGTDDQLALARQAILAARTAVQAFGAGTAVAIDVFTPIPMHLATAAQTARDISDRRQRRGLVADVEALSGDMDVAAQLLGMEPRYPWHISFAAGFDAENRLRESLGLAKRPRPYSGAVDPAEALRQLTQMTSSKDGRDPAAMPPQFQTPVAAIAGIGAQLDWMIEARERRMDTLASDIREGIAPKPPGWGDLLLDVVVNVAIASVAGGIASAIAKGIASRAVEATVNNLTAAKGNSDSKPIWPSWREIERRSLRRSRTTWAKGASLRRPSMLAVAEGWDEGVRQVHGPGALADTGT